MACAKWGLIVKIREQTDKQYWVTDADKNDGAEAGGLEPVTFHTTFLSDRATSLLVGTATSLLVKD